MYQYKQIIYFGAPGTGKSYNVKERLKDVRNDKIFRVTIHPEYTYSDFVGQLLPEENPTTKTVEFSFKKGPFTRALVEAHENYAENVYLILEELSRGNVAAIFGDIFQLLDRNENFESEYPIRNKDIADQIDVLPTNEITLPSNFNIIGTVNTSDQSVYPMDTAFKRRFEWKYVTSRPVKDEDGNFLKKLNNPKVIVLTNKNKIETTWHSFYSALNLFITDNENGLGKSEDKQIGQFFVDFGKVLTENSHSTNTSKADKAKRNITKKIKNKLLLYLWQDVQGNSSFNISSKLFSREIKSFDDLYSKYGYDKVFSDIFIEDFLEPHTDEYPYD